ncbi:MAG: MFS transporter [Planctomycetes bacterium]|nr:MFS transporter [Planctomycetota bacterium]MBI3846672.1 MFS transporter [Planctomycetota bacterium]
MATPTTEPTEETRSKWDQIRTGFSRTFWIANSIELFERFAYYGSKSILAVFLVSKAGLTQGEANIYLGWFTLVLYFLPAAAGTIVDRYGFKKSLAACFSIFCVGYFLIGLTGLAFGQGIVDSIGRKPYVFIVLMFTAVGGSLIKPCIVGTVARTTTPTTKSLGYSIYYTLVNIGGAVGPILADQVNNGIGIEYVLLMSSATSFLLLLGTAAFFREPPRPADAKPPSSLARVFGDMLLVFTNLRFISFLVIFSGFWVMFWQIFFSFPVYVKDYLHNDHFALVETGDAWAVIVFAVPVTALVRQMRPILAMTSGFAIASASWLLLAFSPSSTVAVITLVVFGIGEAMQSPRFYEYVSDLAPKEQVGTFMGFAFLPVALGSFGAGFVGAYLLEHVAKDNPHPEQMWLYVSGIGFATVILMLLYDRFIAPKKTN